NVYLDDARKHAEGVTATCVHEARVVAPKLQVEGDPVIGHPAARLLAETENGVLTVLGSRGRGGFASLLLGSVSQLVATHAASPVVLVRGRPGAIEGPVVVGADGSESARHAIGAAFEAAALRGTTVVAVRA